LVEFFPLFLFGKQQKTIKMKSQLNLIFEFDGNRECNGDSAHPSPPFCPDLILGLGVILITEGYMQIL